MKNITVDLQSLVPGTLCVFYVKSTPEEDFNNAKMCTAFYGGQAIEELETPRTCVPQGGVCMFLGWYPYSPIGCQRNAPKGYAIDMGVVMLYENHMIVCNDTFFKAAFTLLQTR